MFHDLDGRQVVGRVDSGSEIMAEIEIACQRLDLPLYGVLPRSPQYNGCVEKGAFHHPL